MHSIHSLQRDKSSAVAEMGDHARAVCQKVGTMDCDNGKTCPIRGMHCPSASSGTLCFYLLTYLLT